MTWISINKGCVRANHVHKQTRQYNFITKGKIKLVTRFPGKEKKETIENKPKAELKKVELKKEKK